MLVRTTGSHRPAKFTATPSKPTDSVTASASGPNLMIEISSPEGIGAATVTKVQGAWPKHQIVLLAVKGLEKFAVSNGNLTLHASVSSSTSSIRLWADDDELGGKSLPTRARMDIALVDAQGELVASPYTIPLAEGLQFQIVLPPVLFGPAVATLHLSWIDFYR